MPVRLIKLLDVPEGNTQLDIGTCIELDRDQTDVLFVRSGIVAITTANPNARRLIRIAYPGDMLNLADSDPYAQSDNGQVLSRFHAYVATSNATLSAVPSMDVRGRIRANASIATAFSHEMYRVQMATAETSAWWGSRMHERLAKVLTRAHRVSLAPYKDTGRECIPTRHEDLALLVGSRRETLYEPMNRMRDDGWIQVRYGATEVLDYAALLKACEHLENFLPEFQPQS